MKKLKKNDVLTIIGRRWFERVNGNTYHSVAVWVNGDLVGVNEFEYGYGSQYVQSARAILESKYTLPIEAHEAVWRLKDHGIKLVDSCTDVQRKKDL